MNDLVGNYAFYYIEANAFCILILLILYFKTSHSVDRQRSRVLFGETLATAMVYLTIDMFWVLVDSGEIPQTPFWVYLINIAYYVGCSTMSYVVSYFMLVYGGSNRIEEPKIHFITAIPCLINVALVVTTPIHKLCFYVDKKGALITGRLYPLVIMIAILYPVIVAVRAVYLAALKENYSKRHIYRAIGFFPVFPVSLGLVQVFHQKIPFLCFGLTIALLLTYIEFTDDLISLDPLTKLNNRNELYRYMIGKMHTAMAYGTSDIYLMIMDVDRFKQINDIYGHNEGDRALQILSKVLKKVCSMGQNRFVSRFGGDEFIIVVDTADEREIKKIIERINRSLRVAVEMEHIPFELGISIGYAKYDPDRDYDNIADLIERADQKLYDQKRIRHQELDKDKKKLVKVG